MVFSSLMFVFRFLPVAIILHTLAPKKIKNAVLLALSLIFYAWGEPKYLPVMFAVILINFFAALAFEKYANKAALKKGIFIFTMLFNFGMLAFFKYANFFIGTLNNVLSFNMGTFKNLGLPLGISFYTFQIAAYTIDVYLEKQKCEKNIIDFAAFAVLFPQLISGPIVMYRDIRDAMHSRSFNWQQVEEGVKDFILGLACKLIIGNGIGALWTEVSGLGFLNVSTPLAWMALFAFAFQLYFDFSGYSLMAIGLAKMLGFNYPTNFNYPYISASITEFWRRWHITLSTWFRDYLYFPLGGSRCGKLRNYFNLLIVWLATGLWHGASWNYVAWGLYFFIFISLERTFLTDFLKKHRIFAHVYTLFVVLMGWALFAVTDSAALGQFFTRLYSFKGGTDFLYYAKNYAAVFILAGVFSTPLLQKPTEKLFENKLLMTLAYTALFVVCIAYMVDSSFSPFLYFNF